MRILHFIQGKANPNRANGVNQVIYGLAKYQKKLGHEVIVVGISSNMSTDYEQIDRGHFIVDVFKSYKRALPFINKTLDNIDIVHLHGVWYGKNIVLGKLLRKRKVSYVITPHCGYAIDRIKQSNYFLKLCYHRLWQKKLYELSTGIHAITKEESTDIIKFCNHSNIFVIPNGIGHKSDRESFYQVKERDKIKLGYVGRLSTEKNIDNLIKSIELLPNQYKNRIELHLIGPIDNSTSVLNDLVKKLKLEDYIFFDGAKFEEEKQKALLELDGYIHPAYSDVISISVIEALSLGIPTIVTRTSHMSYWYNSNAFIMVEPNKFDIRNGICDFINNKCKWSEYSNNSIKLAREHFNWEKIAYNMIEEYKKAL